VATDLAARGIHVDDIAQVINYDLPEMAENFIHRVGRSGRAGAQGLASTLFSIDQRGELLALERTLGIKIERMKADDLPERKDRKPAAHRNLAPATSRISRLPGEFLQAQTMS
jgi:ATP-dependent RNA helicase RhlE